MIDPLSPSQGHANWGGTGPLKFAVKKSSMPASGGAGYHGMTSKYAFKDDGTESHGGDSTRKAGGKQLKF